MSEGPSRATTSEPTAREPTAAELLEAVRTLSARVEELESELSSVKAGHAAQAIPEDVLVAISAAVAAFLGQRAKVKMVHYRTGQAWAQQGRAVVQGHNNYQRSR